MFYDFVTIFTNNKKTIWILIFVILMILIFLSFKEIITYGDVGGGQHKESLVQSLIQFLLIKSI
jgi:hypothetical protein